MEVVLVNSCLLYTSDAADDRIFSVQYHPESAPGPQDSAYLFDKFVAMMKEAKPHA